MLYKGLISSASALATFQNYTIVLLVIIAAILTYGSLYLHPAYAQVLLQFRRILNSTKHFLIQQILLNYEMHKIYILERYTIIHPKLVKFFVNKYTK
jgi:hypothetical protein